MSNDPPQQGERPQHYDYRYSVVVVGCSEEPRMSSSIVCGVVRKMDGMRVRLQLWDCAPDSEDLARLLPNASVVVVYYETQEQFERYYEAVKPSIETAARLLRVCVNPEQNVGNAPYYFPCKDAASFFSELDDPESKLISGVFWEQAASGLDYRLMGVQDRFDVPEHHSLEIPPTQRSLCNCTLS